ncbi:MAG: hypothetical protein QXJ06_04135, partial [Candidatus Aenigmatarchaeota archaeon]
MQYLIDFLNKHSQVEKLKEKFPDMVEFSKTVEVIPWRKEFEIKDKNPEVIDSIEFLDLLFKNKMISPEQYQQQLNKVVKGFASKTVAISFIEEKQVSFRSAVPDLDTILHELGHVYFEVNDLIWNASYGGGEILFHLALQDKYKINEGHIRRYHAYLIQTFESPDLIHKKIAETIAPKIKVYPHLFPICLFEGYIPEFPEKIDPEV